MTLTDRQKQIIEIVKQQEPISGDRIAKVLGLTRATLRSDFSVLTMLGLLDAKPKVGYCYVSSQAPSMLYQRLFECKVQEIMKRPQFVLQNTTIQDAISDMFLFDVGSLYVVDNHEQLVGILSRKDLLRSAMGGGSNSSYPVAAIMTRTPNLVTSTPTETVLDASKKMMDRQIDSLPVIDPEHPTTVVGRISKTIITHFFTEVGLHIDQKNKQHQN